VRWQAAHALTPLAFRRAAEDVKEKDAMIRYVEEQVARIQELFAQKEARLAADRDAALADAAALSRKLAAASADLEAATHAR